MKVDPRPQHAAQPPEAFHDEFHRLRHDPHAQQNADDNQRGEQQQNDVLTDETQQDVFKVHSNLPTRIPAPDMGHG